MDFCKGLRVLIVCKIFGFTEVAAGVIKKKIEKHGGTAQIKFNPKELDGFSHVLVPAKITEKALEKYLKCKTDLLTSIIVNQNWASDMFIQQQLLDSAKYLWKEPTVSVVKRESNTGFSPPKKMKAEEYITESGRNFNFHLTKELEKLKNYYEILGDKGREITYGNILRSLRLLPFKVDDIEQIRNIEGFGPKTLGKIKEILEKGCLSRVEAFRQNERLTTMGFLTEIYGIGNDMAGILYKKGIKTISSLKEFALQTPDFFSQTQLTAISLHADLQKKIPRDEVEEISEKVRETTVKIDENSIFQVCGSYRRGRDYCGDVDIVISTDSSDLLFELIQTSKVFTHTFSLSSHKFIGLCKTRDHYRRIDIYVCKPNEYWFAVLYFTGSANYNRMLRTSASKKGFHLSNTGMHESTSGKNLILPNCEEDIIKFLGFPIISLPERDI